MGRPRNLTLARAPENNAAPSRRRGLRLALDHWHIAAAVFLLLQLATACSRAPTFNILGSFFPSWILCGIVGILLAALTRLVLLRTGIEPHMSPLVVVYPCLAALFTFTIWLVFFS
jgi:hypothetical protein